MKIDPSNKNHETPKVEKIKNKTNGHIEHTMHRISQLFREALADIEKNKRN